MKDLLLTKWYDFIEAYGKKKVAWFRPLFY